MEIQSGSKHIQKCYTYVEVNIIHRILRRSRYTWLRILKREKKKKEEERDVNCMTLSMWFEKKVK